MTSEYAEFSDDVLTAYLDGMADTATAQGIESARRRDAALAARLAALDVSKELMVDAFDLSAIQAPEIPPHLLSPPAPRRPALFVPALAAACLAAGLFLGFLLRPAAPTGWVEAVASYQALYVTDTLSGPRQPSEATAAVLSQAQEAFGIDLAAAVDLDGLEFKRAQILGFGDQVLLQMAYLDSDGQPFAFCVTRTGGADQIQTSRMTHDLAATDWVENGIGFVLIGGTDRSRVDQMSQALSAAL